MLESAFCSKEACSLGESQIGTATTDKNFLLIETPHPWKNPVNSSKFFDQNINQILIESPKSPRLIAIKPDPQYSNPNFQKIIYFQLPPRYFTQFSKLEYNIPLSQAPDLVKQLLIQNPNLKQFDEYKVKNYKRDILVCTHGARDLCCGKYGYPLYKKIRENSTKNTRVWRSSHLVGHRFSPTILDFPQGRYFGRLEKPNLDILLSQNYSKKFLEKYHRGQAGLTPPEQIVEHQLLLENLPLWPNIYKTFFSIEDEDQYLVKVLTSKNGESGKYKEFIVKKNFDQTTMFDCGKGLSQVESFSLLR